MHRAIVLLSGGMDSLVCAATAMAECEEVYFMHFNYGQRTVAKELECFLALTEHYKPKAAKVVDYTWLQEIGGSALTDINIPVKRTDITTENTESTEGKDIIPNTYVPFRNAMLLCAAVAWAEVIEANRIYIGAVEEDSSGYPDCRDVFFQAFNSVISTGSKAGEIIKIVTPVIHKSKAEIVKLGLKLNAPFHLSWSCYINDSVACGVCDSCSLRLKAFREAGMTDPVPYHIKKCQSGD